MTSDFSILGLPDTATLADAKAARRRLVRRHHPDRTGGDPKAAQRMAEINAAFDRIRAAHVEGRSGATSRAQSSSALGWKANEQVLTRMKNTAIEALIKGGFLERISDLDATELPGIHFVDRIVLSGGILTIYLTTVAVAGRNVILFPRPSFPAGNLKEITLSRFSIETAEISVAKGARSAVLGVYTTPAGERLRVVAEFDPRGGTYMPSIHRVLRRMAEDERVERELAAAIEKAATEKKQTSMIGRFRKLFSRG